MIGYKKSQLSWPFFRLWGWLFKVRKIAIALRFLSMYARLCRLWHRQRIAVISGVSMQKMMQVCHGIFALVSHLFTEWNINMHPKWTRLIFLPVRAWTTCVFPGPASFRLASSTPSSMSCGKRPRVLFMTSTCARSHTASSTARPSAGMAVTIGEI